MPSQIRSRTVPTLENWTTFTFRASNKTTLKVTLEMPRQCLPVNQHYRRGHNPGNNQTRAEHVNWLPDAAAALRPTNRCLVNKKRKKRNRVQTPAEHTICFFAILLIRDTYFHLFLFPSSFHGQCHRPAIFDYLVTIVVLFQKWWNFTSK